MLPTNQGSWRLFRAWGIDVYVHWSWLLVGGIEISNRAGAFDSLAWNVLEYLSLFGIVLLHEFGHALACRQVRGKADRIILWPLGGVAYVQPPPRPGPVLWTIAAGPLVNVVFVPLTCGAWFLADSAGWPLLQPSAYHFLSSLAIINIGLLIFNVLPVYPLDGGQILQALLWFFVGRARSLMVASAMGVVASLGLGGVALWLGNYRLIAILAFLLLRSFAGYQSGRALARLLGMPRNPKLACPQCSESPPAAALWICRGCRRPIEVHSIPVVCPGCGEPVQAIQCAFCGSTSPTERWFGTHQPNVDKGDWLGAD